MRADITDYDLQLDGVKIIGAFAEEGKLAQDFSTD